MLSKTIGTLKGNYYRFTKLYVIYVLAAPKTTP
jgi:hypothetical protein